MIGARQRCPECQARVTSKARWCPACGVALPEKVEEPRPVVEAVPVDATADAAPSAAARRGRSPKSWPAHLRVTVVLVLLLVLVLAAGSRVFFLKRDTTISGGNQQTSGSVRDTVLSRASEATIKAYTVTAVTHERDNAAAEQLMTPKMAAKYSGQVTPAQWKTLAAGGAKQTSKVVADGVTSMTKDTAHVFVLVVVTTTAKDTSSNSVVAYRLNVTMLAQGGTWLVDDMTVIL